MGRLTEGGDEGTDKEGLTGGLTKEELTNG